MRSDLIGATRRKTRIVAPGVVLLLGSVLCFLAAAVQAAPVPVMANTQRAAQETDSLTLFARMMPVLTSPRCFNCHGGTDPAGGDNHGGGAVGANAVCQECHTGSQEWQGISGIKFDTNVMPMCATMRHVVQVLGPSDFVSFLGSDPVVGLGFDGLRGMDENSPYWPMDAESPPIERDEFVQMADTWVTQGKARCGSGGWNGKINYTQVLSSIEPDRNAGETTTIDVAIVNGQATATVVDKRHETSQTPPGPGCPVTRNNTGGASGQVAATVQVALGADEYQIFLTVPDVVSGTWNVDTLNVGGCNAGRVTRAEPYTIGATYTMQGRVDPNNPNHLKGTTESGTFAKTTVTWELDLDDD
jgi:hypothetical protein